MAANTSSISKAVAEGAGSIRIPKPPGVFATTYKDELLASKPLVDTGLPTPPNSISPYLPAHGLSARARKDNLGSPPAQVESDIELGDPVDPPVARLEPKPGYSTRADPGSLVAPGVISPTLIARDYLPDIVLGKGQVPVKEVINQLSNTLPGFIDIPPAKARRIVVGALETRHGGPDGTVEFEKTGWGRWVGKQKQAPRRGSAVMRTVSAGQPTPPLDPTVRRKISAMKMIGGTGRVRKQRRLSHGSWAAESNTSGHDHTDRMDLDIFQQDPEDIRVDADGDRVNRYRGTRYQRAIDDHAFISDTDEEDWASMGVNAWQPSAFAGSAAASKHRRTSRRSRTKSPSSTSTAQAKTTLSKPVLDFTGIDADSQERDAIEALMSMGSM